MKKGLLSLLVIVSMINLNAQTIIPVANELVLPKYIARGNNSSVRIQFACRLKLTGLTGNATYRYLVGGTTDDSLPITTHSFGYMFGISNTNKPVGGHIVGYTASKDLNGTLLDSNVNIPNGGLPRYMEFTTDSLGNYTGWFGMVATGNSVYNIGNEVYFYVQINNGAGGTTVAQNFRTTSTIKVIDYGNNAGVASQSSAIRGNCHGMPENFVIGYDTIGARPAFATWVENDGILTNHTAWYNIAGPNGIDSINGAWGAVYSNNTPTGIVRLELQDVNGTSIFTNNSATGIWGTTNTVNPIAGANPMVISITDAPLPVTYQNITLQQSQLNWSTATEVNNRGFEVWRSNKNGAYKKIGFVAGSGNSKQINQYSFTDDNAPAGQNCYKLKQVDFNGRANFSRVLCGGNQNAPSNNGILLFPNPFTESFEVQIQSNALKAEVEVMNLMGVLVKQQNVWLQFGNGKTTVKTNNLPLGIYIVRVTANGNTYTQKVVKN